MTILGIGIVWVGYALAFWGVAMVQGKDLGILDVTVPGYYARHHQAAKQ